MTRQHLNRDELGALFPTVRRASWRWECQPSYAVDADELNAWLDGKRVADDGRPWLSYIRELRSRGILFERVPFERVRVIDTPLNTYQRWIISTTDGNVATRRPRTARWCCERREAATRVRRDTAPAAR